MKLRTGRRNGRNLYLQVGDQPADDDPCIGFCVEPDDAALIAEAFTSAWHLREMKVNAEVRGDSR